MLLSIEKSRSETCVEKHEILHEATDKILEFRCCMCSHEVVERLLSTTGDSIPFHKAHIYLRLMFNMCVYEKFR